MDLLRESVVRTVEAVQVCESESYGWGGRVDCEVLHAEGGREVDLRWRRVVLGRAAYCATGEGDNGAVFEETGAARAGLLLVGGDL